MNPAKIDENLDLAREMLESTRKLTEEIQKKIADLEAEKKRAAIPPAPSADILDFDIRWRKDSTAYRYVALRVRDKWYITGGNSRKPLTWEELYTWTRAAYYCSPLYQTSTDHNKKVAAPAHFKN